MDYQFWEHAPGPPLGRFVESLWLTLADRPVYRRLAVFPDGQVMVMFNLGRPQGVLGDRGEVASFRHAWLCGPWTKPLTVVGGEDHRLLGIRFRAGGAAPFFGLPVDEVADEVIELETLWPGFVDEVREQVFESPEAAAAFTVIERSLLARVAGPLVPEPLIAESLRRLRTADEPQKIGRLAADLGVTQRHLARVFGRHVGLSPKLTERIFRFGRALARASERGHAAGPRPWTDLAHDLGYYDQAHFIHDFKRFTGMTPTQYDAAQRATEDGGDGPTELILEG